MSKIENIIERAKKADAKAREIMEKADNLRNEADELEETLGDLYDTPAAFAETTSHDHVKIYVSANCVVGGGPSLQKVGMFEDFLIFELDSTAFSDLMDSLVDKKKDALVEAVLSWGDSCSSKQRKADVELAKAIAEYRS